jgi:hypothetical protein
MSKIRTLWSRVKGQVAQLREDEVLDEEVREHIALLEKRYQAQGMSAPEATRAARRQFGNVTVLKERQRAQRGILSPTEWWRDGSADDCDWPLRRHCLHRVAADA